MNVFEVMLVVALVALPLVPSIAGAVIARRAWKRNGWPEAKLAFRAYAAMPVVYLVSAVSMSLTGILVEGRSAFDLLPALAAFFAVVQGALAVLTAIALYRMARRSRPVTSPPLSTRRVSFTLDV